MASGSDNLPKDIIEIDEPFLHKKGLCGLNNLGNTCFMNSIIQCINNTIPLLKFIFSEDFDTYIKKKGPGFKLINQWKNVSKHLWYKNSVFKPTDFLKEVQQLSLKKNNIEFTGYGQNDSQEFLQFFLEALHDTLSREVNMSIDGSPKNKFDKLAIEACKSYRDFFKKDYSIILEIFYGQYFTQFDTFTEDTHEKSRTFDPFSMLSLELVRDSTISIYDCLDNLVESECIIDTADRKIKKTTYFWKLPNVLIIYLKRYNNALRKLTNKVNFPLEDLDMSPYVKGYNKDSYKYDLYAVSNHGGGLGGGHYWSYIKNQDGNWYRFDDRLVSTLDEDNVCGNEAYCLFYIKQS